MDRVFLLLYKFKSKSDSTPEYFPIIVMSTAQSFNFMLFIIPVAFLTRNESIVKGLPIGFLITWVALIIANHIRYVTRRRKEYILSKEIYLSVKFKVAFFIYFIFSIVLPQALIFTLNDLFGRN